MSWKPTGELRWLRIKRDDIQRHPFSISAGNESAVLQQKMVWEHGMDVYTEPQYEWQDIPVQSDQP
jgi:hypothetical protein